MNKPSLSSKPYKKDIFSQEFLTKLSEIIAADPRRLFDYFGIKVNSVSNHLYIPCMIHGGDNCNSLNIYLGGYKVPFLWKCRTHHCEETFKKTAIGFARALFSVKELGWAAPGDNVYGFSPCILSLCKIFKIDPHENVQAITTSVAANKDFILKTDYAVKCQNKVQGLPKSEVQKNLQIPAQYYIDRGYSSGILEKYDVGLCTRSGRKMSGRVVVPVYDESGEKMIGCTGRSIYNKCPKCSSYHGAGFCTDRPGAFPKWKHNFDSKYHLYNYWFAKDIVRQNSAAILVESPGNVWRLEEAGIKNSLAIFGTEFTEPQQYLLEKLGVMNLTLLMDNDPAGREAAGNIYKKCEMYYNLKIVRVPEGVSDVGEMSPEAVRELFTWL